MAVKLRLKRMGKKKQPVYKVVAADSRSPRDGRFIEAIGVYDPKSDPATINITEDRALYWLQVGAEPTDTVKSLLSKSGILLKRDLIKRGLPENDIEAKMADWKNKRETKLISAKEKKEETKKTKKAETAVEAEISESASEVKGAASEDTAAEEKAE